MSTPEERWAKCDRAKIVRRAHHRMTIKLIKEVDDLVGGNPTTFEASARLKVIYKQLDSKLCFLKVKSMRKFLCYVNWKKPYVKWKSQRLQLPKS